MRSFLIPAYQTQGCLQSALPRLIAHLSADAGETFELLLLPNGANRIAYSETVAECRKLAGEYPEIRVVECTPDLGHGKGFALAAGLRAARGETLFFIDADLPYEFDFFDQAREVLAGGADFVVGNRRHSQSRFTISQRALKHVYRRQRLSLTLNFFFRKVFHLNSADTQAGIKAFRRPFAEAVAELARCRGFLFDLECFLIARANDFRVCDLPVHLDLPDEKSTIRVIRETRRLLSELTRIFFRSLGGGYSLRRNLRAKLQRGMSLREKLFLQLRETCTPYAKVAAAMPEHGRILDLCAGHGLFSVELLASRRGEAVQALEWAPNRIRALERLGRIHPRFSANRSDLRAWNPAAHAFEGIALIDSLHYFEPAEQARIVGKIFHALVPGGKFAMREVDRRFTLRSVLNRGYERFAIRFGITEAAGDSPLHFRTVAEWRTLLEAAGFRVYVRRCRHWLFSDVLFEAVVPETPFIPYAGAIVSADDWGLSPAINQGILELAQRGIVRKVSLFADAAFTDERLDELRAVPGIQLGLHFNLTYRSYFRGPGDLLRTCLFSFGSARVRLRAQVAEEFARQMGELDKRGIRAEHIDGHHHVHIFPQVFEVLIPLLRARSISRVRLPLDRATLFSARAPLFFLAWRVSGFLRSAPWQALPFRYPSTKHFAQPGRLAAYLNESGRSEVITHPATSVDFDAEGIEDELREARVIEYRGLLHAFH